MSITVDQPEPTVAPLEFIVADDEKKKEFVIPYPIRKQFRPKLQEFFIQIEQDRGFAHNGTYLRAERLAKEWFLENYQIPLDGWGYRK